MRRVIYSFYIDIPKDKVVSHPESVDLFKENYNWLRDKHEEYANAIGVEYKHFFSDKKFEYYRLWFEEHYPEVSFYNIVNFYKIQLMYSLIDDYDEILYLDMDVIPVTKENIFDEIDLDKGVAILTGTHANQTDIKLQDTLKYNHHVRSPMAKLWNTRCMLSDYGIYLKEPEVFNTGIVCARSDDLRKLAYFEDFNQTLDIMRDMTTDEFYPESIRKMFGYDNETVWGYKTHINNVDYQPLDDWHFFMDNWSYISKSAKFVHCVSKDFEYVRNYCEKNNL